MFFCTCRCDIDIAPTKQGTNIFAQLTIHFLAVNIKLNSSKRRSQMKVGEFIDLLGQSEFIEGRSWVEQFKRENYKYWWEEVENDALDRNFVLSLDRIFKSIIQRSIIRLSTCTEEFSTIKQGHAFLREIHQKAILQGIEVKENEIDGFLSAVESQHLSGVSSSWIER